MASADLPRSGGHPFYERLNRVLDEARPHDDWGDGSSKTITATRCAAARRAGLWQPPPSRNRQKTPPLKQANRRRCERKQKPQNRVRAKKGIGRKPWKTPACSLSTTFANTPCLPLLDGAAGSLPTHEDTPRRNPATRRSYSPGVDSPVGFRPSRARYRVCGRIHLFLSV